MISARIFDKPITVAFTASFLFHLFILGPLYASFKITSRKANRIEVTYLRSKSFGETGKHIFDAVTSGKEVKENSAKPSNVTSKEYPEPKFQKLGKKEVYKIKSGETGRQKLSSNLVKGIPDKAPVENVAKEGFSYKSGKVNEPKAINLNNIKASNIEPSFLKEPGFINYYEAVRLKIKESLEGDYSSLKDSGDVTVNFKIGKNGELKSAGVTEGRSSKNSFLQELALNGIKNSAPFKPIPDNFDEKELNFVITISFRLK